MPWQPPDPQFELTLQRIVSRARENSIIAFDREFEEIRHKYHGSGAVVKLGESAAQRAIMALRGQLLPDLLGLLQQIYKPLPADVIDWVRQTVNGNVRAVAVGLAERLDAERARMRIPAGSRPGLDPTTWASERDVEIELGTLELRARFSAPSPIADGAAPPQRGADFDAFISHASEDQADVAEPLASALVARGFTVWLDKVEIKIGDRLFDKIDDGLRRSKFGVIVLSPHFFAKKWTTWELNALAALEATAGRGKTLPVWHNLTPVEVAAYSPLLAAIRAARTSEGIDSIADEIAAVLRDMRRP